MRLRNIKGSRETIAASEYSIKEEREEGRSFAQRYDWSVKGHWDEIFSNDNELRVEIGMGKGSFLMTQARLNPDINFVGVEKFSSVLLRAIQKQEEEKLPNIRFIRMEAENICDVFAADEVSRIYLNFSDPWPKAAHAPRRLSSRQFLKRYFQILKPGGLIEFKTDNQALFDFSLEEAEAAGWPLLCSSADLHNDPVMNEGNIMTEYEERFSAQGNNIYKLILSRPLEAADHDQLSSSSDMISLAAHQT